MCYILSVPTNVFHLKCSNYVQSTSRCTNIFHLESTNVIHLESTNVIHLKCTSVIYLKCTNVKH